MEGTSGGGMPLVFLGCFLWRQNYLLISTVYEVNTIKSADKYVCIISLKAP